MTAAADPWGRNPPSKRLRGTITRRIAAGPGSMHRLRARRYGMNRLLGRSPALELYYQPGDPHSHLCAQLLPRLQQRLRIPVNVHVVPAPVEALYPEAHKQRAFALRDATRIAPAWGLAFPADARVPSVATRDAAAARLVGVGDVQTFVERERSLAEWLWRDEALNATPTSAQHAALARAQHRRDWLGHYLPAMWQFDGEWFWGLDRLTHLEARLRARDLLAGDEPLADLDPRAARLPDCRGDLPLEFFYSFRSPYSYLAAEQMLALQPRLGVPLRIRPVLPMVMRGLKVPAAKRLYIVRDVYREAQRLNIPFGRIADPVGAGAERCLGIFPLLEGADAQLAYMTSAARAAWAQAVDLAEDRGLHHVCVRAGLDWERAKVTLASAPSLDYAEANRVALFEAGLWGVPSFRLGEFTTWGRDRLWMVEEMLRRAGALEPV